MLNKQAAENFDPWALFFFLFNIFTNIICSASDSHELAELFFLFLSILRPHCTLQALT